ncbi:MAG: hypothetical protein NTY01_04825 [Verrucomicrobia bacterium]|nr:hypothetical protein [Verrucomicrobiota bacterium]
MVEASRGGKSSDQLIEEIKKCGVGFRPSNEDKTALQVGGVGAAVVEAIRANYRPTGPPLSLVDMVLLLQLKVPKDRIERILETRGVDFAVSKQTAKQLLDAGGDNSMVGIVALHQKTPGGS